MSESTFKFYTEDDWVARRWYILEVIWWIATNRIPYNRPEGAFIEDTYLDINTEYQNIRLTHSELMAIESDYTDDLPMSPSPFLHDKFIHTDALKSKLGDLKSLTESVPSVELDGFHHSEIREIEDEIFRRKQWVSEQKSKLDTHVLSIFTALKEGRLKALGFKLPATSVDLGNAYVKRKSLRFAYMNLVEILPEEWTLQGMLWDDCILQTENHIFAGIQLSLPLKTGPSFT